MLRVQDSGHFVQFFDSDDQFVREVTAFLISGFDAGDTCVCVATSAHRAGIDARLASLGFDPNALVATYRYIPLDAHAALATFMKDERLDREIFHREVGRLIAQAASRGAPVCIFGEMVTLLGQQGLGQEVLELEELWNELSRQHTFTLFCGYPNGLLGQRLFDNVCAVHSHVVRAA